MSSLNCNLRHQKPKPNQDQLLGIHHFHNQWIVVNILIYDDLRHSFFYVMCVSSYNTVYLKLYELQSLYQKFKYKIVVHQGNDQNNYVS